MHRPSALVLPAYLVFTLLLTWPLAREFGRALPAGPGGNDPLIQSFILGWDWKALASRPQRVFDAPNFYPERRTLTYLDHLLGEALVAAPVAAATRSIPPAYNSLVVLSFVVTAWAGYRLLRSLGGSCSGSFLAGFLLAFSPYRLSNLGNLNQLHTEFVPLALWFALSYVRTRRARDLALASGTLVVQSYFGWYYAFHLAVALILLGLYEQGVRRDFGRPPISWSRVVLASGVAGALMLPGALPYWQEHRAMPGFNRTLGHTALYSADLVDYLKTHYESRLAALTPWRMGGQAYWFGLVTVVLGLIGLRSIKRPQPAPAKRSGWSARLSTLGAEGFFLLLGAAGFILSLGPVLKVAGLRLPVPLPYAALYFVVPGFSSMRAPGRFAELALLAAVVLAGRGYDATRQRLGPRGRSPALLLGALLAVAVVESYSVPLAMVAFPDRTGMPAVYAWLAGQPGEFAVLELPLPAGEAEEKERDAIRQVYSLYHGKARADGVSGFSPPQHERFRRLMQDFPGAAAVHAAATRGIRYLVVRYGEFEPEEAERVRDEAGRAPGLHLFAQFGQDIVYTLQPSDP